MTVWQRTNAEEAGYLWSLSDAIAIVEDRHPGILHPTAGDLLYIFSDYSGQHKAATHEAYSFLIARQEDISRWLQLRDVWRDTYLPDGRRLSFKNLREPLRKKAFLPFLETASKLRANAITFMIDREVGSFAGGNIREYFPDCFDGKESEATLEKMTRVAALVSLVVAGLRQEGQVSNWVSDHDEALETHDRREGLARLSGYFTNGLTCWSNPAVQHFGTTESSLALEWYEDLAAIPDILAGAYCKLASLLPTHFGITSVQVVSEQKLAEIDPRARAVGNWLSKDSEVLRHILVRLQVDHGGETRATAQFFKRHHK